MKLVSLFKQSIKLPEVLGVNEVALQRQGTLLKPMLAVKKVTNAKEQELAVAAARDVQTYVKSVKDAGLTFRRPINDFVSLIKKTEDEHLAPLLQEQDRIKKLCADFQEKENRRIAAEEAAQREAYAKAEQERLELERKANEAALKAAESGKAKDMKKADELQNQAAAAEQTVQQILAVPLPEKAKPIGLGTRKVLRWEVTDINALVKARPDLCKIEPKASAINATCIPEMPNKPPGLKLWWENTATFRSL